MAEKSFLSAQEHAELDKVLELRESQVPVQDIHAAPRTISKEDILRRIEEDRERHKRLRESLWVVPRQDLDFEFNQAWEETSDLGSDDFEVIREEMALWKQSVEI